MSNIVIQKRPGISQIQLIARDKKTSELAVEANSVSREPDFASLAKCAEPATSKPQNKSDATIIGAIPGVPK